MILNVSSRTDIVAFYTEWFLNRLKAGFIDVRNPFNPQMISRILMEEVDLLYFCTKNPLPLIPHLHEINKKMYFHITLTGYKQDIEPNVPSKKKIIEAIQKISKEIGKENIVIRYDPIFVNDTYTIEYHKKAFERICQLLEGSIQKILIHFLDDYKNVRKNYRNIRYKSLTEEDYKELATSFSKSAKKHGIVVHTCNEQKDFTEYGFVKGECLSHELAFRLTGKIYKEEWKARKDLVCHCVNMVDIGVYNTCKHFCKYCYANFDEEKVEKNASNHDASSSLLIGKIAPDDRIKIRKK